MNKQQKLTFLTCLQLCLKVILIVLLFVDGMFVVNTTRKSYTDGILYMTREVEYPQSGLDVALSTFEADQNFIDENNMGWKYYNDHLGVNNTLCQILMLVTFGFLLLDIIIDLLKILSKKTHCNKLRIILPIFTLLVFLTTSIYHMFNTSNITFYEKIRVDYYRPYLEFFANPSLGALFYVLIGIFLVVIIIHIYNMVLSDKNLTKKTIPVEAEEKTNISVPEELTKYKELLENNIITEEEFEAKKKQLLDL